MFIFYKMTVYDMLVKVKVSDHWYCLFVCFVALRPKSIVHLTTLFPGQA